MFITSEITSSQITEPEDTTPIEPSVVEEVSEPIEENPVEPEIEEKKLETEIVPEEIKEIPLSEPEVIPIPEQPIVESQIEPLQEIEVKPEVSEPELKPEVSEPELQPEVSEPELKPEVSEPELQPEVSEPQKIEEPEIVVAPQIDKIISQVEEFISMEKMTEPEVVQQAQEADVEITYEISSDVTVEEPKPDIQETPEKPEEVKKFKN
jgi:hypothetical protein